MFEIAEWALQGFFRYFSFKGSRALLRLHSTIVHFVIESFDHRKGLGLFRFTATAVY
jgi:hypothetical protein